MVAEENREQPVVFRRPGRGARYPPQAGAPVLPILQVLAAMSVRASIFSFVIYRARKVFTALPERLTTRPAHKLQRDRGDGAFSAIAMDPVLPSIHTRIVSDQIFLRIIPPLLCPSNLFLRPVLKVFPSSYFGVAPPRESALRYFSFPPHLCSLYVFLRPGPISQAGFPSERKRHARACSEAEQGGGGQALYLPKEE